jgi:hypothetical protein
MKKNDSPGRRSVSQNTIQCFHDHDHDLRQGSHSVLNLQAGEEDFYAIITTIITKTISITIYSSLIAMCD